mmetsp:Transcript_42981/g.86644  ORF Transcript_42981/g.86644 Transcript_42981/m.86644 type:complete len:94 (+) Transcript_42981:83-364(+)
MADSAPATQAAERPGSSGDAVDDADAQVQAALARQRARRKARAKKLQYNFLFKSGAFLVMLAVVLITKQVQKWMKPEDGANSTSPEIKQKGEL